MCLKEYGNQAPLMNKNLKKAIMSFATLRNIFLRNRSDEKKINFDKKSGYCDSVLRKAKVEYYCNLDTKTLCDNKRF